MSEIQVEKVDQPDLAKHDSSVLDLAFAMDCTGSMSSYIRSAQRSIHKIVEEIVAKEQSDINLALVEYRDHPPQDSSFVTRPHDFTNKVGKMKGWLDDCSASGGGDSPEAVADALHQVLKLSWRDEATKICVFIADAPPHGLQKSGDGFPKGCPDGLDPMTITHQLAEKGVTIYMVGCEPAINRHRDFFMAIAHLTGGQYVPLRNAELLAQVIIGGAQEEISLQKLMEDVNIEVVQEYEAAGGEGAIDEEELSAKVYKKMQSKGAKTRQLRSHNAALPEANMKSKMYSKFTNMDDLRMNYEEGKEEGGMGSAKCRRPKKLLSASPAAGRPSSSGGGGIMTGISNFSKAASKSKMVEAEVEIADGDEEGEDDIECTDSAPPPSAASKVEENYGMVDQSLDYQQTKRMVQRSIVTRKLKK